MVAVRAAIYPVAGNGYARLWSTRRHYNRIRQFRARVRQGQLLKAACAGEYNLDTRLGREALYQVLATQFKVSVSTIRRDLKAILSRSPVCPLCGQDVPTSPKLKQDTRSK